MTVRSDKLVAVPATLPRPAGGAHRDLGPGASGPKTFGHCAEEVGFIIAPASREEAIMLPHSEEV